MKKSKFTGERVAFALRQAEVGTAVAKMCRKMGVSEATHYRWRTPIPAAPSDPTSAASASGFYRLRNWHGSGKCLPNCAPATISRSAQGARSSHCCC
jgi:hypothetical protein